MSYDIAMQQLRWTLQALSLDASQQKELFPPFTCIADELVLDFDQWFNALLERNILNFDQLVELRALNQLITQMTDMHNSGLWTEEALAPNPLWGKVREVSLRCLDAFGWALEAPPVDRATYAIAGTRTTIS